MGKRRGTTRDRNERPVEESRARGGWKARAILPALLTLAALGVAGSAVVDLVQLHQPQPSYHASVSVEGEPVPGLTQNTAQAALAAGPTGPTPLHIDVRAGDPSTAKNMPPQTGILTIIVGQETDAVSSRDIVEVVTPAELLALLERNGGRDQQGLASALAMNLRLGQTGTAIAATAQSTWAEMAYLTPVKNPPVVRWFVVGLILLGAVVSMLPVRRRYEEVRTARSIWLGARRRAARVVLDLEALEVTALTASGTPANERLMRGYRRVRQRALAMTAAMDTEPPGDAFIEELALHADNESRSLAGDADALILEAQLARGGAAAEAAWSTLIDPALRALNRLEREAPSDAQTVLLLRLRPRLNTLWESAASMPPEAALAAWASLTDEALGIMRGAPVGKAVTLATAESVSASSLDGVVRDQSEARTAMARSLTSGADLSTALNDRLRSIHESAAAGAELTRARQASRRGPAWRRGARTGAGAGRGAARHRIGASRGGVRRFPWIGASITCLIVGIILTIIVCIPVRNDQSERWRAWLYREDPVATGDHRVSDVRLVTKDKDGSSVANPALEEELRTAVRDVPLPFDARVTVLVVPFSSGTWLDELATARSAVPQLFDPTSREPLPGDIIMMAGDTGNPRALLTNLFIDRPNLDPSGSSNIDAWPQYPAYPNVDLNASLGAQVARALSDVSAGPGRLANEARYTEASFTTVAASAWLFFTWGGFLLWRVLWKRRGAQAARRAAKATTKDFLRAQRTLRLLVVNEDEQALNAAAAHRWDEPSARDEHAVAAGMFRRGVVLALRWRDELAAVPRSALQDSAVRMRFSRFGDLVSTLEASAHGTARSAKQVIAASFERIDRKRADED